MRICAVSSILLVVCAGCGETPPREQAYNPDSFLDIEEISPDPSAGVSEGTVYTIRKGDTLSEISQRVYGTAKLWRKILEANPGIDPRALRIGQKIVIPAR